ncbi:MAG: hypothetical protein LBO20_10205 [Bifidobacteriaceae bacterium]|jgi:hypothetical protein|nr:hypothetical protein [Bifidobacteriaceae bacterium]
MSNKKTGARARIRGGVAVACAALLGGFAAPAASAQGDPGLGEATAQAIAAADPIAAQVAAGKIVEDDVVTEAAGSSVAIPLDPAEPVKVASTTQQDRSVLTIASATGNDLGEGSLASDGTVVYLGSPAGIDQAVQALSDGSVRLEAVIKSADAPNEIAYEVGSAFTLTPNADGTVTVLEDFGELALAAAVIDQPWAVDANGSEIPTRYEVDGNLLVQVVEVESTTAYPVVADPKITSTWWNTTIYFNRSETKSAITVSGWTQAVGGVTPLPAVIKGVLVAAAATVNAVARLAYDNGQCLKLVIYGWPPAVWTWAPHNATRSEAGGYCR